MSEMIPIASDHAGFEMRKRLSAELKKLGYETEEVGAADASTPDDYPDSAHQVARQVAGGKVKRAILLCGSGIGMDMVANRYRGVRAALAWKPEIGAMSRKHNNSNVLVLPARFMSNEEGVETMKAWLDTSFEGGRHERRVKKIEPEGK